jgi:hypothetical protein
MMTVKGAPRTWKEGAMTLTWTREKPTVPGWYWWRGNKQDFAQTTYVQFSEAGNGCVSFTEGQRYKPLREVCGEWAGPLAEPKEA